MDGLVVPPGEREAARRMSADLFRLQRVHVNERRGPGSSGRPVITEPMSVAAPIMTPDCD